MSSVLPRNRAEADAYNNYRYAYMSEVFGALSSLNAHLVNHIYFTQRVALQARSFGAGLVVIVDLLNVWRFPQHDAYIPRPPRSVTPWGATSDATKVNLLSSA